jgi:hypothetical protein
MPLHDWTRVDAGLYHDFHQSWTVALSHALNRGVLPSDYFALIEQASSAVADVVNVGVLPAVDSRLDVDRTPPVTPVPARPKMRRQTEAEVYAGRANRIAVRERDGRLVALVEVVSPGNTASPAAFRALITKWTSLLYRGVHLLVIDPFPTVPHNPLGIHGAIWDSVIEDVEEFVSPAPKRARTMVSYQCGEFPVAVPRFVTVGEALPDITLYLRRYVTIQAPLEASYRTAWEQFPRVLRGLLEGPTVNS